MASSSTKSLLPLFFLLFLGQNQVFALRKSYVVYLGGHSHSHATSEDVNRVTNSHHDLLASILGSKESAKEAIFYSYTRHINGFAATLEEEDAHKIAKHPDVVSVFSNKGKNLHTTDSWRFLMLEDANNGADRAVHPESLWEKANYGNGAIIANVDTGVWPESESFSDHGILGPIPSKWKGSCENATIVPCNRKLIGAKYFNKAYQVGAGGQINRTLNTARDHDGHGTHTLSTAGGNFVGNATVVGFPVGTAKGGSPGARVASYKACWPGVNGSSGGCWDGDVLAAFDAAIDDGVDVISVSLGGDPDNYFEDVIAIGAFHAMQRNIVVIASAGNDGPAPASASNLAPWLLTVAASTIDRRFQSAVQLPNGLLLKGASLSKPMPQKKFYPLIYAGLAKTANSSLGDAELCCKESLDRKKVQGKIVVCMRGKTDRVEKGYVAALAGAVGMILSNDADSGNDIMADPHFLPATQITYADSLSLFSYMNSTKDPKAYIQPSEKILHKKPAPEVAAFSSRGPNAVTPEILKPDITAPGVDIVAAYSQDVSPTEESYDERRTLFIVMSGTSMSCPHVSGVVGLLKSLHPDWSPAAIKSAIMTTSRTRDNTNNPMRDELDHSKSTPFAYGAGHLRPNRAMDPGLVYDLSIKNHLNFLCGVGYNETVIRAIANQPHQCPKEFSLNYYNYPSISVTNLKPNEIVTVKRAVKNVGSPGTYAARLRHLAGVSMSVKPAILTFDKIGEEKSFKLTLKAADHHNGASPSHGFGELIWSDGKHYVRSPIAVAFAPRKN